MGEAKAPRVRRILIVDDDDLDRYVIVRSFKALGDDVELIEVSDSTAAAEAVRTYRPDITLLDLQMPSMTGFDVLDALAREDDAPNPTATVLVLSSSTREVDRLRALEKGADAYHVKPATLDGYDALAEQVKSSYLM